MCIKNSAMCYDNGNVRYVENRELIKQNNLHKQKLE